MGMIMLIELSHVFGDRPRIQPEQAAGRTSKPIPLARDAEQLIDESFIIGNAGSFTEQAESDVPGPDSGPAFPAPVRFFHLFAFFGG
jgi:hypothetical protein